MESLTITGGFAYVEMSTRAEAEKAKARLSANSFPEMQWAQGFGRKAQHENGRGFSFDFKSGVCWIPIRELRPDRDAWDWVMGASLYDDCSERRKGIQCREDPGWIVAYYWRNRRRDTDGIQQKAGPGA